MSKIRLTLLATLLIRRSHDIRAQMAELVDALASGASVRKDVEVRVLFWAPSFFITVLPKIDRVT